MENLKLKDSLLGKDLLKILERGSLNDVKIKLSDGEIVANKDILMARSDYFATMFSNNKFIEGETDSVDMTYCSKAVMERIVKFLFSGEVTFDQLSLPQLLELSYTTDMMLLAKFKDKLEDYVEKYVDVNNDNGENEKFFPELISGLKLACQYNLTYIKEMIVLELNCCAIKDVTVKGHIKTLPFNLMKEIFLSDAYDDDEEFIKAKASDIEGFKASERLRFKALTYWLSENEASDEQMTDIVESFDFENFTADELLTSVRDSGLFSVKKIDKRFLDILNNKDLVLKEKELKIKKLEG